MRSRMIRGLAAGCLCAVMAAPASGQTPALKALMRSKLAHSQQLLDAVVTSKWAELESHTAALRKITEQPAWLVLQSPEYARQTARFVRTLNDLGAAARRKDLDEASAAYTAMTASCVQCHRDVARMRIAGPSQAPGRP